MASDKAEVSSESENDEYLPHESLTKHKTTHKRKRQIVDSSEDEEDDDTKHNDNKPLRRKKRRKLTQPQTNNENTSIPNTMNKQKQNEIKENVEEERHESHGKKEEEEESYFCAAIDEEEMIQMADMIEEKYHQNNTQCQEPKCNSVTICPMYLKHFKIHVCRECKWKPKYKCLSKTNAKKQYLLSEGDINSLHCWVKDIKQSNKSSHNSTQWMPKYMKLYLIYQLEELSLERYGSKEGLEAERNRREVNRMQRAISNARKKRKKKFECLDDIEIDKKVVEEHEANSHTHTFGDAQCIDEENDEWSKKCTECGYVETWEEF
eukprot:41624_1